MEYDAIIIGAGAAGLASALKLSCAGKKILLLEKQPEPGGFGTSFSRKGFVFESSLHCVDGLAKDGEVRNFLEECGVDKKIEFISLKDFSRIIYPEHDFVADFNRDNFINYLKKSFPKEAQNLDLLFAEFDKFYIQFDRFSYSRLPAWLKLLISPFAYPAIIKISFLTFGELVAKFISDEKLRAIISDIWRFIGLPPLKVSALYFLLVFRGYYYKSTAYIRGGYSRVFGAMVERIREAGSEVRFNTAVKKIVVKKGLKCVITDQEDEFKAKVIISNANCLDTLTNLLDNEITKDEYSNKLARMEKSVSAFQVYMGLKVPAKVLGMNHFMFSVNSSYNHGNNFNYPLVGNYDRCPFSLVDHAQLDQALVPPGKGSLLIMILDAWSNWSNLTEEEYNEKKIQVANRLISQAERYLPGLAKNIEVMEVATPRTIARYGSSPEGAIYGFAQTVSQSGMSRLAQKTKVKGLILAGAWTRPGAGVHACFVSGIEAADLALKLL